MLIDRPVSRRSIRFLVMTAVVGQWPGTATAAGFYFPEAGSPSSLGTGGVANVTNIYGADAAWTNPAGMNAMDEDRLFVGMQVVAPKIEFNDSIATAGGSDGGNAGETAYIPSVFYLRKVSDDLRLGLSLTVPLGGEVDYGDNFVGRYETISTLLEGLALSASLGYEVNDHLSLGGGISFIYTLFEQDIAINPEVVPTVNGADGKLKIEDADDWGYQPFLGITYRLSDELLFGAVYRAEMDVDLEGDVQFSNLGEFTPPIDSVDVGWDNPQTIEVGLSYQLGEYDTLFFNAGWEEWSQFSDNKLDFTGVGVAVLDRNWDDTWRAGIGFSHLENRQGYSIGLSYESSPVEDEDRTFDLAVDELYRLSGSYSWTGRRGLDYSVGASLVMFGDTEIDNTVQGVRVKGEFDSNYLLFVGGTVRYVL